jgi:transcription elongation factor GreA
MTAPIGAAALLREVGLLPDGPVPWGRPVGARSAGVLILEAPAPRATAPIELTRIGKWLERVPTLRLDGERPSSRALAARLASFWLPGQTILYIGSTSGSIGGRVTSIETTVLGERRPHPAGSWSKALTVLPTCRWWWCATDAAEEYEDALIEAFAAAVPPAERAGLPTGAEPWPFAVLRRPTGDRRPTGISGWLLPEEPSTPPPPTRVVVVPDGDAEGARGEPPEPRRKAATARTTGASSGAAAKAGGVATGGGADRAATGGGAMRASTTETTLTAEGAARLRAELAELTEVRRPEVVARIRAAKELGDLKENADYTAAREEQSFLEGRIQALEARLRNAVIADAPVAGGGADLGSTVRVEVDGLEETYMLVGSAEADASAGRVSVVSPVGRALVGARAGTEVIVTTPRGPATYKVLAVD